MKSFIKRRDSESTVLLSLPSGPIPLSGFWPLVTEQLEFSGIIGVGTKGGIPVGSSELKKTIGEHLRLVVNTQSAPMLLGQRERLYSEFDGVFDLDFQQRNPEKSLSCSHSMMVRSLPFEAFFWEPAPIHDTQPKEYDFIMLSWGPRDSICKRWDRQREIALLLCNAGYKGALFIQRDLGLGLDADMLHLVDSGRLFLEIEELPFREFHREVLKARCAIFPNTVDAFPKFIIEALLADLPIAVSSDLLIGHHLLSQLPESVAQMVNFNGSDWKEQVLRFMAHNSGRTHSLPGNNCSPRTEWLSRFEFRKLTGMWAAEINRLFDTSFRHLFFLNHIHRVSAYFASIADELQEEETKWSRCCGIVGDVEVSL